jgi:hypothetical protein
MGRARVLKALAQADGKKGGLKSEARQSLTVFDAS